MTDPTSSPSPATRASLLVWCGPLACAIGIVAHRLWEDLPWARTLELAAIAGLVALPAWALVRWRGWAWADALALVWAAALVALAGPAGAAAAALLTAASLGLGSLVHPRASIAFAVGAALIAGTVGWLLPLTVHHPLVHAGVLAAIVALRARSLREAARDARASWRAAVERAPRAAAWTVTILGLASSAAWAPTVQADDLAYHLGLPWQLMLHGRYALDPTHQVWALAPWASDVLHGVVQVIAREEGRGALNACWLVASAALLARIMAALDASALARWGAVAVFGSLPPLAMLMGGMQTELAACVVTLALVAVALEAPAARGLVAAAVLVGALFGLKLVHPAAAAGVAILIAWRCRTLLRRQPAWWLAAPALAIAVGGSSYAYAWLVSGNPVLPLFNGVFDSPFFAAQDFRDARWGHGVDPRLPWTITFDTERYLEAWDGGFGFVPVALGGAAMAAVRSPALRGLLAAALVAFLLPLAFVHYARYAFVGVVLLIPVAIRLLDEALPVRQAAVLVTMLCALNLAFVPNAHWVLHTGGAKRALAAGGRDAPFLRRYAPERIAVAWIRASAPSARVIDLTGAAHAELAGRGLTAAWYAPAVERAATEAERDPSGRQWAALLRRLDVDYALLRPASLTPARRAGLVRAGARSVLTVDEVECWRLPAPMSR